MPVHGRRSAVVFLRKKPCRLIVFRKCFGHFQLSFVCFIKLTLNKLVFKQIFAAEQHLHTGIQWDRIRYPMNDRILFRNAGDQLLHNILHRLAVHIQLLVNTFAILFHPCHIDAHKVENRFLSRLHLGYHSAQLVIRHFNNLDIDAGLLFKQRQQPSDRFACRIFDR